MNLSAQDHQTFFTGDTPQLRPEDTGEFKSIHSVAKESNISVFTTTIQVNSSL